MACAKVMVEAGGDDGVCQSDGRGEKVQWCVPGRQQRQERLMAWAKWSHTIIRLNSKSGQQL